MKPEHLKEAASIVERLAYIADALTWADTHVGYSKLYMHGPARPGYGGPEVKEATLSKAAQAAAFKIWRAELVERRAQLYRRAAQIGLLVEREL